MSSPASGIHAAVVGGTGLVGRHILDILLRHPNIASVPTFVRRPLAVEDAQSRLRTIVAADSTTWSTEFAKLHPAPSLFLSALGTTKAQAGSFAKQYEIDHDLNLSLAKAAKGAGVEVYVLVSSAGASTNSYVPYSKMKGELEEAVIALDFEKTVIVQPGLIVGERRKEDGRPMEYAARRVADLLGAVSGGMLKDSWAQDADAIASAAVEAGLRCLDGSAPAVKVWHVGARDIMHLSKAK